MSEAAAPETGMPTHGAFCWSELATNNLEACRAFYKNVFGRACMRRSILDWLWKRSCR